LNISKEFNLYLTVRNLYFRNSKYLFPAISGQKLQYSKFVARLTTLAENSGIKLESFNPAGCIKERIAFSMISDAESKGLLKNGGIMLFQFHYQCIEAG